MVCHGERLELKLQVHFQVQSVCISGLRQETLKAIGFPQLDWVCIVEQLNME
jgi:hypothetical protein